MLQIEIPLSDGQIHVLAYCFVFLAFASLVFGFWYCSNTWKETMKERRLLTMEKKKEKQRELFYN